MAAVTAGARPVIAADDPGMRGPFPTRASGPGAADRSPAAVRPGRTVRSWPLLVLAAPAAAEVWSGWVGIAQKTGFGLVSPLPGIWPSLHLDTTITLPVGVEAYAAYALRAWLATGHAVSARTRRFAKWSAIGSFALGMAGQVAYHLLEQAGVTRAPWAITTIVSCLPVLVLAMGTALAHMLRADTAHAAPPSRTGGPALHPGPGDQDRGDHAGPGQDQSTGDQSTGDQSTGDRTPAGLRLSSRIGPPPRRDHAAPAKIAAAPAACTVRPDTGQARLIAERLAAAGKPVSRRALRSSGAKGSNQALNALARTINNQPAPAGTAPAPGRT
jgi:hypothetical protein